MRSLVALLILLLHSAHASAQTAYVWTGTYWQPVQCAGGSCQGWGSPNCFGGYCQPQPQIQRPPSRPQPQVGGEQGGPVPQYEIRQRPNNPALPSPPPATTPTAPIAGPAGPQGPAGKDGKDADQTAIKELVEVNVKILAALEKQKPCQCDNSQLIAKVDALAVAVANIHANSPKTGPVPEKPAEPVGAQRLYLRAVPIQ